MMDKFTMLFLNVQDELDLCRQILRDEFRSDITLVNQIGDHVLQRPGKMLRPAVVIASAKVCGCANSLSMARVAAVLEMMHNATLVHDDSIDHAKTRRGVETVHQKWDHQTAVLMGDYLYAKALNTLLKEDNLELMKILGEATVRMCEAEIFQLEMNFNPNITEAQYFKIIDGKTAALVMAGCQLGAVLGNANPALKYAFGQFGQRIGLAFQIIDDLFDYTAEAQEVGKPVGHDLREGKITLPLIHAFQQAAPHETGPIKEMIRARQITDDLWTAAKNMAQRYDGLTYAHRKAHQLISEGLVFAEAFPQSLFKLTMMHLAQYILKRAY